MQDFLWKWMNLEKALGKETLELTVVQEEKRNKSRSIYVVKDMKKGEMFTDDNIKSIRPAKGMHTMYYDQIIGKRATKDLPFATPLSFGDVLW